MAISILPVCTMGNEVRIVAFDEVGLHEVARFDIISPKLAAALNKQWEEARPAFFWLGAEADNG